MKIDRVGYSLITLVLWLGVPSLPRLFFARQQASLVDQVSSGVLILPFIGIAVLFAVCWGMGWKDMGLNRARADFRFRLLWVPLIYMAVLVSVAVSVGLPPLTTMGIVLFNVCFAAFSEELMFRGVLLQGLRSRFPIWHSILISTAMFGAIHVLNYFGTGKLDEAILQAFGAGILGLMFVAIRLRSGSLFLAALVHAGWNFCLILAAISVVPLQAATGGQGEVNAASVIFAAVIFLPLPIYSLYLLRGIGRRVID